MSTIFVTKKSCFKMKSAYVQIQNTTDLPFTYFAPVSYYIYYLWLVIFDSEVVIDNQLNKILFNEANISL